jgi:hypothetical protein
MLIDGDESVWKMLLKQLIKIVAAIVMVVLAVVLSDYATKDDKKIMKHVSKLPVISDSDELEKSKENGSGEYILEGIALSGTPVHDTTGCFNGDYYYLDIYAEVCSRTTSDDGTNGGYCWSRDKDGCSTDVSKDLKVSCCDTKYFLENVNASRLYLDRSDLVSDHFVDINYYYPGGSADASEGNLRYSYTGLPVGETYSAWINIKDGQITFKKAGSGYIFISGDSKAFINYLDECIDSSTGLIGAIFLILAAALTIWIPISIVVWIKKKFF